MPVTQRININKNRKEFVSDNTQSLTMLAHFESGADIDEVITALQELKADGATNIAFTDRNEIVGYSEPTQGELLQAKKAKLEEELEDVNFQIANPGQGNGNGNGNGGGNGNGNNPN